MSFQRYPLATLQKVSQFVRTSLELPDAEQHPTLPSVTPIDDDDDTLVPNSLDALGDLFRIGDIPEDNLPAPNLEGRWFISTVNPAEALAKLPGLWLKAGIRLVTFLQRQQECGVGITWALPDLLSTTEFLETAIQQAAEEAKPPHPNGALPNLLNALEGDGSLASFLSASIFLREVQEFGRFGKQARWQHHRFVAAIPPKVTWQWRTKQPADLTPKVVTLPDGQIIVEFFTCRVQAPIALFRHVDRYTPNSYQASTGDQVIATVSPKRV